MDNQKILKAIYVILFLTVVSYLSYAHGYQVLSSLFNNDTPPPALTVQQPASAVKPPLPGPTIKKPIPEAPTPKTPVAPTTANAAIQVALLLDVSGSMNGLIEQAKSQLWTIVNELAAYEKAEGEVDLQIALYAYGSTDHLLAKNEIVKLSDFTTDMDNISELLFALRTSGSKEYCGEVIGNSLDDLKWLRGHDNLKVIYIVGNETFEQGRVDFRTTCAQAVESGIVVNTIFCGDKQNGIGLKWEAAAKAGKGVYFNIDHNQKTAYIETPFDATINQLNTQLNETYIPIGDYGASKIQNQSLQDENAAYYSVSNLAERSKFKCSKKYKNTSWDLCDAYKDNKNILVEKQKELPKALQDKSTEELEAFVNAKINQRDAINQQMQAQHKLRDAFIREQQKTQAADTNLNQSVVESVKILAKEKQFVKAKE